MIDNRLFAKHTGRLFISITGVGAEEIFGDWSLLNFILMAYKKLTGEDKRTLKEQEHIEAKNWRLIKVFLRGNDGLIEVERMG